MITLNNINKDFLLGNEKFQVLKNVSLNVTEGEFISIMGQSGSGKSTLLNIVGMLDRNYQGKYSINGVDTTSLSQVEFTKFRNNHLGWVFQNFKLIQNITVSENVGLPLTYQGVSQKNINKRVSEVLKKVNLFEKANEFPKLLSGGQQQRVAIARSLVTNPDLLLADEPTGALDSNTSKDIIQLFKQINKEGTTIIMVTHDEQVGSQADKLLRFTDGQINL